MVIIPTKAKKQKRVLPGALLIAAVANIQFTGWIFVAAGAVAGNAILAFFGIAHKSNPGFADVAFANGKRSLPIYVCRWAQYLAIAAFGNQYRGARHRRIGTIGNNEAGFAIVA